MSNNGMDLAGSLLVISDDARVVEPGDLVTSKDWGPFHEDVSGVFQGITDSGMVIVATAPGHVHTVRPERFGLMVTGVSTCGCAVTVAERSGVRVHRGCAGHPGMVTFRVDGIPELDDLF